MQNSIQQSKTLRLMNQHNDWPRYTIITSSSWATNKIIAPLQKKF